MPQAKKSVSRASTSKGPQKQQQQKRASSRGKTNPKQKPVQVTTQELEDGWTQYGGGFGTRWNPSTDRKHPKEITGIVTSKRELPAGGKFKKPGGFVEVSTGDGESWSIGKSSSIASWFDAVHVGDEVRLRYTGLVKIKGQRNPMIGIQGLIRSDKKRRK